MNSYPLLSQEDSAQGSETSLDPLGLYPTADILAIKLVSGIRERMKHPRFLTAIAVSQHICSAFDKDEIAADRISEPWQVFEWYFVEGMVRSVSDKEQLQGLPGSDKTSRAVREGGGLSAKKYLKTPSVFGFHGVYRLLSKTLKVEEGDHLGEGGDELLRVWAREQGIEGFVGSTGEGSSLRDSVVQAVRDGLKEGATDRSAGWGGWNFFSRHLNHRGPGKTEAKVIARLLRNEQKSYLAEVLDFLVSREGRNFWRSEESERAFHGYLAKTTGPEIKSLLKAIMIYEEFARTLTNAFEACLYCMSSVSSRIRTGDLANLKEVKDAAKKIPHLFPEIKERVAPYLENDGLENRFGEVSEITSHHKDWIENLIEHHLRVQKSKLPTPKVPWFERMDDGSCYIRPAYRRERPLQSEVLDQYVHGYRTFPLWSFVRDLGMVSQ